MTNKLGSYRTAILIAAFFSLFICCGFVSAADKPGAMYVGSDKCKLCHAKVYDEWALTAHAKTLTAQVPDKAKGCESCHGPGNLHAASTGKVKLATPDSKKLSDFDSVCTSCHASSSNNSMPAELQKLTAAYWKRSEHARKGISCLACHSAHTSAAKLLTLDPKDPCSKCHSGVAGDKKPGSYTHTPVAQKMCISCHNPHGTSQANMVVTNVQSVCVTCHKPGADLNQKHGGYAVGASDCMDCHNPHSRDKAGALVKQQQHGPFKSMGCKSCHKPAGPDGTISLVKPEKELCVTCHSKGLSEEQGAHSPVAQGMCTACHSPHASDSPKALLRSTTIGDLCSTCHSKVLAAIDQAKYPHKPVQDLDCTQCHKPHSSAEGKLLKKASMDLCKTCHETHPHPMGKNPDGTEVKDPTTGKMLVCASCHEPHGSQFEHLTRGDYERDLCVRCHKEGMHG